MTLFNTEAATTTIYTSKQTRNSQLIYTITLWHVNKSRDLFLTFNVILWQQSMCLLVMIDTHRQAGAQPRLQSRGPVPWSRVLLPLYRKKIRQVYSVGYIITLYSSKSYVKRGPSKFWGSWPPEPATHWLHPCHVSRSLWLSNKLLLRPIFHYNNLV